MMRSRGGGAAAGVSMTILSILFLTSFAYASSSMLSEVSAPKPRHKNLLKSAVHRQISNEQKSDLWMPLANQGWKPCVDSSTGPMPSPENSQGYLQLFLDGGLNQQRMGICDAVALAKILNATLVIPYLELNPVWKDSSSFMDIYDVDHFINVLKNDIPVVKDLPEDFSWSTREYYSTAIRATRIKTAPLRA
ncbi:hypothetical protein AgCh_014433 [Apium graveolens]